MRKTLLIGAGALLFLTTGARAQEIEPRAYTNAPVGVNFVIVGLTDARGAVPFDSSVPITDANLRTTSGLFAFARTLDLWGKSAKVDVIAPYTDLSGTALYRGDPVSRDVRGWADPRVRLSVNFIGAPALTLPDFMRYRQDLIVGASLAVTAPAGQYDPTRLVNIGSNRWAFKPEVGVSKALGHWTLELAAAVTLFTDNEDFYGGSTRTQDPLYALQTHVIYSFTGSKWLSVDATYYSGGRSTLDGVLSNDLQQNWRVGATLALPVNVRNSVKLYASSGVSARTGNNYDLYGVGWQYRWGGGL